MLKISLLSILLVALSTDFFDAAVVPAASNVNSTVCWNGTQFYFEKSTKHKLSRDDADRHCQRLNMRLVSVENSSKDQFITKRITDLGLRREHFWTSGWQNGNGTWYWNNGPIKYTNWQRGSPKYKEKFYCIYYEKKDLRWKDGKCKEKYLFICDVRKNC